MPSLSEPVWATDIGYHAFDDRWPDMSEQGRQAELSMLRHHRARLATFDEADLPFSEQIDLAIVREVLDGWEFSEGVLRQYAWDPLSYVQQAGNGLFSLLAREYAPWAHRGPAFLGRVSRAWRSSSPMRASRWPGSPAGRCRCCTPRLPSPRSPASPSWLSRAWRRRRRAEDGEEPDLAVAIEPAAPAVARRSTNSVPPSQDEIKPRAEGEARLGRDLFGQKLRFTLVQ